MQLEIVNSVSELLSSNIFTILDNPCLVFLVWVTLTTTVQLANIDVRGEVFIYTKRWMFRGCLLLCLDLLPHQ